MLGDKAIPETTLQEWAEDKSYYRHYTGSTPDVPGRIPGDNYKNKMADRCPICFQKLADCRGFGE